MPQNPQHNNKPRPVRPNMGYFGFCFLVLITIGFYVPVYYKKFIAKINILSEHAGTKQANFSPKLMTISLLIIIGTIPAMAALAFIFPNVVGAIPDALIAVPMCLVLGAALCIVGYCIHMINHVSSVLKEIAYQYDRMDAVTLIEETGFSWREKASFDAFDILAEHYNNRIGYSIRRY